MVYIYPRDAPNGAHEFGRSACIYIFTKSTIVYTVPYGLALMASSMSCCDGSDWFLCRRGFKDARVVPGALRISLVRPW
jgi:hypothetical protein